ncbi:hypothetical protein AT257_23815 [Bacillus cereus]|nr:hypothetical protein AT257_23815 [Bacillus cereus]
MVSFLRSSFERAASAFRCYPAPAARTVGHFAPSCEAKSASSSGAPMTFCSERAASAFRYYLALAAKMFGGFASSAEAKSASMSEAPSSSHFGRAASAFN